MMIELHKVGGTRVLINVGNISEIVEPIYPHYPVVVRLGDGKRYEVTESYETIKDLITKPTLTN